MKIKDRELIPRDIPEIPIMEPNAFYAGKKVETSYKEYAVIIGEDNSIHFGEFERNISVTSKTICIFISQYESILMSLNYRNFFEEKTELFKLFENIRSCSGYQRLITIYNKKGLVTSYQAGDILITFKYNENHQPMEWTATISGQLPYTRQLLYNENGQLSKVIDTNVSGFVQEWLYDTRGNIIAYIEDGETKEWYEYTYNQKGKLEGIEFYRKGMVERKTSYQYDEKGNKTQLNFFDNQQEEIENWREVYINSYKDGTICKQEIHYYFDGSKDILFFDEQGRIIQKQSFEYKHYRSFHQEETVYYKYFEGKVERTQIDNEGYKEVIVCRDIEYSKEPSYRKNIGYDPYNEDIFSCLLCEHHGHEERKHVRTYSSNGEWETIFYYGGVPSHIVRKECKVLEE